MKNRKILFISIGICLFAFVFVVAYWTILPRHGTIEIPGEVVYIGQLRGHTFHGYGTYTNHAIGGTSYEGEWKDGMFHGLGTLTFANGSQLVGEFHHGHLFGRGKSICPDGHVKIVDFGERKHDDDCSGCDHHH